MKESYPIAVSVYYRGGGSGSPDLETWSGAIMSGLPFTTKVTGRSRLETIGNMTLPQ